MSDLPSITFTIGHHEDSEAVIQKHIHEMWELMESQGLDMAHKLEMTMVVTIRAVRDED